MRHSKWRNAEEKEEKEEREWEKDEGIVEKFQSLKKEKLACVPKDYDFYGFFHPLCRWSA